jgi:hypothetical protein
MSTFSNPIIGHQLGLQLDKDTYTSGEQVNGVVFTNLMVDPKGSQIILKIKGKEYVNFHRKVKREKKKHQKLAFTPDDGGDHYDVKQFTQTHHFLNHMYQLIAWDETADTTSKQNKFPITFNLPVGIPSSFRMNWKHLGEDNGSEIIYYIKVYLVPPSQEGNVHNQDVGKISLTKKIYFQVLQSEDGVRQKPTCQIKGTVMKCWFAFRGFVDVSAKLDKTYYYPEDTAKLYVHANNSFSLVDIQAIK